MYIVLLEFSERWGLLQKNPFCEGGTCMDILCSYTFSSKFREPSRRASSQKQRVVNQLQISLQFLSSLADLKNHIRYTIVNQCFLPMAVNC